MNTAKLSMLELGLLEWVESQQDSTLVDTDWEVECLYMDVLKEIEVTMPQSLGSLAVSDTWVIQAVADCANCLAKVESEIYYQLKDWCLTQLSARHAPTLSISWSWSMPMVTVSTPEMGVSCYHCPTLWMESWNQLPRSGDWSGIRRQMAAFSLVNNTKLRKIVAWATRVAMGPGDSIATRVNALLGGSPKPRLP